MGSGSEDIDQTPSEQGLLRGQQMEDGGEDEDTIRMGGLGEGWKRRGHWQTCCMRRVPKVGDLHILQRHVLVSSSSPRIHVSVS